jgi:hypothetical protein
MWITPVVQVLYVTTLNMKIGTASKGFKGNGCFFVTISLYTKDEACSVALREQKARVTPLCDFAILHSSADLYVQL